MVGRNSGGRQTSFNIYIGTHRVVYVTTHTDGTINASNKKDKRGEKRHWFDMCTRTETLENIALELHFSYNWHVMCHNTNALNERNGLTWSCYGLTLFGRRSCTVGFDDTQYLHILFVCGVWICELNTIDHFNECRFNELAIETPFFFETLPLLSCVERHLVGGAGLRQDIFHTYPLPAPPPPPMYPELLYRFCPGLEGDSFCKKGGKTHLNRNQFGTSFCMCDDAIWVLLKIRSRQVRWGFVSHCFNPQVICRISVSWSGVFARCIQLINSKKETLSQQTIKKICNNREEEGCAN